MENLVTEMLEAFDNGDMEKTNRIIEVILKAVE